MSDYGWSIFCDKNLPPYTHDINNREIKVGDLVRFTPLAEQAGYFGIVIITSTPDLGETDVAIVMDEDFRPHFGTKRLGEKDGSASCRNIAARQGYLEVIDRDKIKRNGS